jgi:FkbM family methyltransferase
MFWKVGTALPAFRGKSRLLSFLARPRRPAGIDVCRQGVRYRLWGHDLNEWYVASQPSHSTDVSDCLDRMATRGSTCVLWDIGANIGGVALPFLRRNGDARVVCFEPSPEVGGRLMTNLGINPELASRCDVVTCPLTDRDVPTRFFASSETFNSGVGGLGESHNRRATPFRTMGVSGDSVVEVWDVRPPTIIKLDVEGFELEVLQGLTKTLKRHRPAIVFEHSLYRLRERGSACLDVVTGHLRRHGYEVYRLDGSGPIGLADLDRDCDLLALPLPD